MISGNVPTHLVSTAKAGFLSTALKPVPAWSPIAAMVNLTEKNQTLVDLGNAPMPSKTKSGPPSAGDFIEKALAVKPLDWHIKVPISGNAVKDDQTGSLLGRVRAAGSNFERHIAQQAFQTLNDGDSSTLVAPGYDGLPLFSNSHVDKGAAYATVQDNLDSASLSLANFETQMAKAKLVKDDQGEYTDYNYDLLVVDPTQRLVAWQICNAGGGSDDTTKANPNKGNVNFIITPKFDAGAWVLVASKEVTKPVLIVMREQPFLDDAWKDPDGDDGGTYWFLFRGRYNFYFGDWRLAQMGHS